MRKRNYFPAIITFLLPSIPLVAHFRSKMLLNSLNEQYAYVDQRYRSLKWSVRTINSEFTEKDLAVLVDSEIPNKLKSMVLPELKVWKFFLLSKTLRTDVEQTISGIDFYYELTQPGLFSSESLAKTQNLLQKRISEFHSQPQQSACPDKNNTECLKKNARKLIDALEKSEGEIKNPLRDFRKLVYKKYGKNFLGLESTAALEKIGTRLSESESQNSLHKQIKEDFSKIQSELQKNRQTEGIVRSFFEDAAFSLNGIKTEIQTKNPLFKHGVTELFALGDVRMVLPNLDSGNENIFSILLHEFTHAVSFTGVKPDLYVRQLTPNSYFEEVIPYLFENIFFEPQVLEKNTNNSLKTLAQKYRGKTRLLTQSIVGFKNTVARASALERFYSESDKGIDTFESSDLLYSELENIVNRPLAPLNEVDATLHASTIVSANSQNGELPLAGSLELLRIVRETIENAGRDSDIDSFFLKIGTNINSRKSAIDGFKKYAGLAD